MVGGDAGAFERAKPVMDAYAKAVTLMGDAGRGPARPRWSTRSASPASCRVWPRAELRACAPGSTRTSVLDVIAKGAAQSWQMENRGTDHARRQVRFRLRRRLDAQGSRICLDEARRNGARLPITALIDQFYAQVQAARRRPLGHVEPDPSVGQRLRRASNP